MIEIGDIVRAHTGRLGTVIDILFRERQEYAVNIEHGTHDHHYNHKISKLLLIGNETMIKQIDGKFYLYSKDGSKKLGGPYDRRSQAVKREREVLYFKNRNGGK